MRCKNLDRGAGAGAGAGAVQAPILDVIMNMFILMFNEQLSSMSSLYINNEHVYYNV